MREIIFKGKRINNGEWLCGNLTVWSDGSASIDKEPTEASVLYAVDPETVGQYTGLTDKDGKKIFEGDIVKAYNICGEEEGIGVVHWSKLFAAWHYANNKCMYGGDIASYEIIGNITDNPELIKEAKEDGKLD